MVKKIGVFITILGLFFVGIPQFKSNASIVIPVNDGTITIGSLNYTQGGSSEYFNVYFSVPRHNVSNYTIDDILYNVTEAFGHNNTVALYNIKQEVNNKFEYRLLNSSYNVIEVMPKFDTMMFISETNEMAILLNGDVIKSYNNAMGISRLELVYTGIYDANDYEGGYLHGYNDGLINGSTTGYAEGYTEARRELWTERYELGYNDGQVIGYNNGLIAGEIIGYNDGQAIGYNNGLIAGEIIGYEKGLIATDATGFVALLGAVFGGLGTLLAIEILPGIYIGAIFAVPLVFGIIFFILGKKKE